MAGHGMKKSGQKTTGGRRKGLKTQGRSKPKPKRVILKEQVEVWEHKMRMQRHRY